MREVALECGAIEHRAADLWGGLQDPIVRQNASRAAGCPMDLTVPNWRWRTTISWRGCGRFGGVSVAMGFGNRPNIGGGKPAGKPGYISNCTNNLAAQVRNANAS